MRFGGQSLVAPLGAVVVKRPAEAYRSPAGIAGEWERLGYLRPPDLERAVIEHERFVSLLGDFGAEVLYLPENPQTGLDSIYTHDVALVTDSGALIFQAGKVERRGEGPAFADFCSEHGIPVLAGVGGAATAEGGDMLWLDAQTLVVGRGFRTNRAAILRLMALVEPKGISVVSVDLPYSQGRQDVLHLMSLISPLDEDLAVVFRPLLPVPLFELLEARQIELVDTPEDEYRSLGTNVLALSPRNAVMVAGNPVTRGRLERAGCRIQEFEGQEICHPGAGGPTCLARPVWRKANTHRQER